MVDVGKGVFSGAETPTVMVGVTVPDISACGAIVGVGSTNVVAVGVGVKVAVGVGDETEFLIYFIGKAVQENLTLSNVG